MNRHDLRSAGLRLSAVLAKELRSRMWGWRPAIIITLYLCMLGLPALGMVWVTQSSMAYGGSYYQIAQLGQQIFILLAFFQLLLVVFIVPGLTAGAIAGEKERQTLDLLLVTRLSSFSIVLGKLVSSLAYVLLLLLASVPVFSLAFLFGGVSPMLVAKAFLVTFSTALLIGVAGIFISTLIRRSQMATVTTYGVAFFLTFGLIVAGVILLGASAAARSGQPELPWVFYLNPLAALTSAVVQPDSGMYIPFVGGFPSGPPGPGAQAQPLPLWRTYLAIVAGLSLTLLLAAAALLRPPRLPWRQRRQMARKPVEAQT